MRWLSLLLLLACRTEPLELGVDGGPKSQPDLSPQSCGGFAGVSWSPNQFCEIATGQCFNDSQGTCMETPSNCSSIFVPVCGCDGVTYPNDCLRQRAGVPLAFDGPCEAPFDEAQTVIDLSRPVDLAQPVDLGASEPCGQSCGAAQYCYVPCCGTPGCTPSPPSCIDDPSNCHSCSCWQQRTGCDCVEDAAGLITVTCSLCP